MSETTLEVILKNKNISYVQLGEQLGVTKQLVSLWATGKRQIGEQYVDLIAEILNVDKGIITVGLSSKTEIMRLKKQQLIKECEMFGISFEQL